MRWLPWVSMGSLVLSGCASVERISHPEIATIHQNFDARLGVNRVFLASGSRLVMSMVDGSPAFCSTIPAYFALGESRGVCFFDSAGSGYLDKYYVLGTLRNLTYEAHIPYSMEGKPPLVVSIDQDPTNAASTSPANQAIAIQERRAAAVHQYEHDAAQSMRDPDSAKFVDSYLTTQHGRDLMCGEVNGRNAFGGYTGRQPYFYVIDTKELVLGHNQYFANAVAGMCNGSRTF
jgi:hypothetical protein